MTKNLVLIGMPGVGKSTIGAKLAECYQRPFLDTDDLLKEAIQQPLQKYLNKFGYQSLREQEERVILLHTFNHSVIATGGSVVYSSRLMQRFKENSIVIYLKAPLETIQHRLGDFGNRGIAAPAYYSLQDIFLERGPLYAEHADLIVNANCLQETIINTILSALS